MINILARNLWFLLAAICCNIILPLQTSFAVNKELNLDKIEDPQVTPMPSMFNLFFKLIISLVIIAGLSYLMMKLLRKNMKALSGGVAINVLDQYSFSFNKSIYITQIVGKVYVLGVTENNINMITEITDQEAIDEILERARERELEPVIPPSILERILPNSLLQPESRHQSFSKHIQKQIKKLQSVVEHRGKNSREDERNE
jgi:flagellar protein FliO/FliZ